MRPGPVRLLVVGVGGHGRELLDIVDAVNATSQAVDLVGVVDERGDPGGFLVRRGVRLLGGNDAIHGTRADAYAVGIGAPSGRRKINELAEEANLLPFSLIHPTVILGSDVRLGVGFLAAANAQVTTNVTVGRHVHLNLGATISHDCVLGDYVTLSPGCHVSGEVHIGDAVTLGAGAVIKPGVSIGAETVVGAGAAVISDLPPGVTAAGVPARVIRR